MYSEEQIERLKVQLKDYLYYFGYTNHPVEDNDTAFFEYSEHDESDIARFKGFKASNEKVLSEIGVTNPFIPSYEFNNGGFMKLNLLTAPMPYDKVSFAPHEDGL